MGKFVKNSLFIILFLLVFNCTLLCQKLPFRNYLKKDGLPSSVIRRISQDSKGYLWFGTNNGLSRFDGVQFKNFSKENGLPDNTISAISEDRAGNILIGTGKGVATYSPSGEFTLIPPNKLEKSSIYCITEDEEGILWFGGSSGLGCYDGKTFRYFSRADGFHANEVFAMVFEKKDKLWLGTDTGLICYEKGNFIDYSTAGGLLNHKVNALLYDSGGNLWIGTIKGLNRFTNGKVTAYTKQEGLCHDSVVIITEDDEDNIWIGTWEGASRFTGGRFINYGTQNGLPNNFIYSIAQDREGNTWFGTYHGVSCLSSLNIKTYSQEQGLPNNMIFDIIQDKEGRYWFGTMDGLGCYQQGQFKNYTTNDGLIYNVVNYLMQDSRGKIWISTFHGLSIFSSGSFVNYTEKDGLAGNIISECMESRDGTVWIGTNRGLTRHKNGKFSDPPFKMDPTRVFHIMEDSRGNLWFSSQSKLYSYSGNRLTAHVNREGLPDNTIKAIFEDSKGKMWIGTEDGLSCYDKGKFTLYSTANSTMTDNTCYCLLEDAQGCLWIGNAGGFTCFDGKTFKTYTSQRLGLAGTSWETGMKDNSGKLWFGSSEGVTCFFPPPVNINTTPPPVYITGIKVMEREIPLSDARRFPYNRNIFRFSFTGISFSIPDGVHYKYRLTDIDKDWQTTRDRTLFYPFLPPGSYNLRVKAVNADGIESIRAAEYAFNILPPYWATWWFRGLLVLVVASFLLLVINWRVKRTQEIADIRAREKELHARNRQLVMSQRMELMGTLAAGAVHDLKNLMSIIIGYSRMMSAKPHSDRDDHQNIEIIKETAATAVQMTKQILSFARPRNYHQHEQVELGIVVSEIMNTLKITQLKNMQIHWQVPEEPVLFPIHPARFQQLVMNLCINSSHATPDGGELRVSLNKKENEIILEIADTGTGIAKEHLDKIFDPLFTTKEQGKGTGLGLFVVKQIVDEFKGTIDVHSEPGKGTTFLIHFPLSPSPEVKSN